MDGFVQILLDITHSMGYGGVFFLMTVESSFIPFPSEIVIPPAAYLASKGEMNVYLIIICGIAGSVVGALINYFLAYVLGRPVIYKLARHRYAKYFLINEAGVLKAENYLLKYGNVSTFIGRLVPAIRQLISLPAGFAKMRLKSFLLYTTLGSSFWVIILAILGYFFGENEAVIEQYYTEIGYGFIALALFVIIFIVLKNRKRR